jgi:hypothetical protein
MFAYWQVLLPHSREIKIEGVRLSAAYMAIFERNGGLQASVAWLLSPCHRCRLKQRWLVLWTIKRMCLSFSSGFS